MRNYRKALCAPVLALVLASSALAGDIQRPANPPAPENSGVMHTGRTAPPSSGEIHHGVTDGEMQTGKNASTLVADMAIGITLSLLHNLLLLS